MLIAGLDLKALLEMTVTLPNERESTGRSADDFHQVHQAVCVFFCGVMAAAGESAPLVYLRPAHSHATGDDGDKNLQLRLCFSGRPDEAGGEGGSPPDDGQRSLVPESSHRVHGGRPDRRQTAGRRVRRVSVERDHRVLHRRSDT